MLAVLVHLGLLAWGLARVPGPLDSSCLTVCGVFSGLTALGLLVIFLITAFSSRKALPLVVFPSLFVAGAWAHLTSRVAAAESIGRLGLAAALGWGGLCVAVTLSFGAVSMGSRVSPEWGQTRLARCAAFWVGALGLAAVVGVGAASRQLAPAALVVAGVGIVTLGASLGGVDRETARGAAMEEVISAVLLSLGAVWTASISAGARTLSAGFDDWPRAGTAMRFAWLSAMPLVLAAFVAIGPRLSAAGAGVLRGWAFVLTTTVGVVTCVGLGKAVLARSSQVVARLTRAERAAHVGRSNAPGRPGPAPAPKAPFPSDVVSPAAPGTGGGPGTTIQTASSTSSVDVSAAGSGAAGAAGGRNEGSGAAEDRGQELGLSYEGKRTHLGLQVTTTGPMTPEVAEQGITKSFQRLATCYEEASYEGQQVEAHVEFVVNPRGGVKTVDFVGPDTADSRFVACIQLAFLRSGFQRSADNTRMDIAMSFAPND